MLGQGGSAETQSGSGPLPQGREEGGRSARLGSDLALAIRDELLLRFASLRRKAAAPDRPAAEMPADPERLAVLLCKGRFSEARAAIQARIEAGADPIKVMIEELAPAARQLGVLWESDEYDFFDVTVGARALKLMMDELAPDSELSSGAAAPAILILLAPGETHELGAEMTARVFRAAGWRADRGDVANVGRRVARKWYDVVGFSASCERYVGGLRSSIAETRIRSRNRKLRILVGGPVFAGNGALAESLGADVCASDRDVAAHLPHTLLEALRL